MASPQPHYPQDFPYLIACPVCTHPCDTLPNQRTGVALHVCLHCGELLAFQAVRDHPALVRPSPEQLRVFREDTYRWRAAQRIAQSVKQFRLWKPAKTDWRQ